MQGLKIRKQYRVINTYPKSILPIGTIIEQENEKAYSFLKGGKRYVTYITRIEDYPHLFQPVEL